MNILIKSFILLVILYRTKSKIIRVGRNVEARFTLIDTNYRVKANCVKNITNLKSNQKCADACTQETICSTFNYHREKGICELLDISKFDAVGLLQRDNGWSHYETDDDASNVGPVCERLKPCQPYQVCEDTFDCETQFVCKCKDGFQGDKCQNYEGPGRTPTKRAPNCYLLLERLKEIPNGNYWFEGRDKKMFCGRRVDGGYAMWSSFITPCSRVCGNGVRTRYRNCSNPSPENGGEDCSLLGPAEDTKACSVLNCPRMNRLNLRLNEMELQESHLLHTIKHFDKQFVVALQFKPTIVPDSLQAIVHLKTEEDNERYGRRVVHAAFTPDRKLVFDSTFFDNPYIETKKQFPLNQWITIQMEQIVSGGSHVYKIHVNHEILFSRTNTDAKNLKNVTVYAGSTNDMITSLGHIANFVVFQPDLCIEEAHCDTNANCSSVVGSYNCTCKEDQGWFGNGTLCARACVIRVLSNDISSDKSRVGRYFFYERHQLPFFHKQLINGINSRTGKNGLIKLFSGRWDGYVGDSHGRFEEYTDSDWSTGDLVMIDDPNFCPTGVSWQLQKASVSFGARGEDYGEFSISKTGLLYSLALDYKSGAVKCHQSNKYTYWGCYEGDQNIHVVIVDASNEVLLPREAFDKKAYLLDGFNADSKTLPFHTINNPLRVTAGDQLKIAFLEDLKGTNEHDNSGVVHVDVYAIII